MQRYLAVFIKD